MNTAETKTRTGITIAGIAFFLVIALVAIALATLPAATAHGGVDDGHPDELILPPSVVKLQEYQASIVAGLTLLAAFLAGIITFTSPCSFVVLPMFFSIIFREKQNAVRMTIAFSIGLIIAFVIFGLIAAAVGTFFNSFKETLAIVSGILIIIFGIMTFLNIGFKGLGKAFAPEKTVGILGMAVIGFFFAVGWTPCVGPVMSTILLLAANTGALIKGALLLFAYGLGISLPLIILASFSDKFDWAKKIRGKQRELRLFGKTIRTTTYNIIASILLVLIGAVMLFTQGTRMFETLALQYTPWGMANYYALNDAVIGAGFGSLGNIIGGAVVFLFIAGMIYYLVKRRDRSQN